MPVRSTATAELYIGRLIWNRLAYAKEPDTGRRRSRLRTGQEQVATPVPDLRIIDDFAIR